MKGIFENCLLFEALEGFSDQDIRIVIDINSMLFNCNSLKKISNITKWNTSMF